MALNKTDNVVYVETPEGVDIGLLPATLSQRAFAWFLDLVIKGVLLVCGAICAAFVGTELPWGIYMLLLFIISWFYNPVFEWKSGRTPGKKMVGIRVVSFQGTQIRLEQALARHFICFVELNPMPFVYSIATVFTLFTRGNRRLGDLVAGTMVIQDEKISKRRVGWKKLSSKKSPIQVTPQRPPMALNSEEKSLLKSYYSRAAHYHEEYRQELAEILYPLHRSEGRDADECLLAYGAWLSGELKEDESQSTKPAVKLKRRRAAHASK